MAPSSQCSNVALHLYVDDVLETTTAFEAPGGSTTVTLPWPRDGKAHQLGVEGEGQTGGCNMGALIAWSATLAVTYEPRPIGQVMLGSLQFDIDSFNYGTSSAVCDPSSSAHGGACAYEINVTKQTDSVTTGLRDAESKGTTFPTGTVRLFTAGTRDVIATYRYRQVFVSDLATSNGVDHVTLRARFLTNPQQAAVFDACGAIAQDPADTNLNQVLSSNGFVLPIKLPDPGTIVAGWDIGQNTPVAADAASATGPSTCQKGTGQLAGHVPVSG